MNVLNEIMALLLYACWNFTPSRVVFFVNVNVLWVHFMVNVLVGMNWTWWRMSPRWVWEKRFTVVCRGVCSTALVSNGRDPKIPEAATLVQLNYVKFVEFPTEIYDTQLYTNSIQHPSQSQSAQYECLWKFLVFILLYLSSPCTESIYKDYLLVGWGQYRGPMNSPLKVLIGAALIKKYSSYRTKQKKVPRVFSPKP